MSSGWALGSLPYKLGTTLLGGQTGRSVKAAGAITIPPGAASEQTPQPGAPPAQAQGSMASPCGCSLPSSGGRVLVDLSP